MIEAVLFDFGGVVTTSPFDAFNAYERETGLPEGLIRTLNATNADRNAWARLERSEVDVNGFCALFEAEAETAGHKVDAQRVVACLQGNPRPQMVEALKRIRTRKRLACLTNNFVNAERDPRPEMEKIMALFEVVIESSKTGLRKPDPRFYALACETLGVEPAQCVFLDDLGINLKPAKAMGMTTIKVVDPDQALAELEAVLGFNLR